jgi:hypothetical protein
MEEIMDLMSTTQVLGNVGAFIGALGVVATLVYLSVQIRINTRQLRAQSIVTMNSEHNQTLKDMDADPELLSAFVRSAADWNAVSPREQARAHLLHTRYTNTIETAFLLMQQGCLEEARYRKREEDLIRGLNGRGAREWWSNWKWLYTQEFQDQIDKRLADQPPAHYTEQVSFYHPDVWAKDA